MRKATMPSSKGVIRLKELQVFRPSIFQISIPFQMAGMSQAEDNQTNYEALMGQVSIVLDFRLVSC